MTNQLAQFLAARQGRSLTDAATQGLGTARPPHISREGNRFTLVDGAGNKRNCSQLDDKGNLFMDMVVVDVNPNKSKVFYGGAAFNADEGAPPKCFSDNGVGPSTMAAEPQAPTCAICPHNEWGSAISSMTQKPIRACRDQKKVAVVIPGDDSGLVYEFTVPPASFSDKETGWVRYINSIKGYMIGDRKADICDVVTRVYFLPGQMGVLGFQPVSLVEQDEALVGRILQAWSNDMAATKAVTGILDKPRDPNALVAPRPVAQAASASPPPLSPPPVQPASFPAIGQPIAPQAAAPAAEPPKRGRGRPKVSEAASTQAPFLSAPVAAPAGIPPTTLGAPSAAMTSPPSDGVIPPFLKRTPAAPTQPAVIAGVATNPAAPPSDMQAALDAAFNLNIPGAPQ